MYTDIHAHLLPGVDDGPDTMEESMQLVDLMATEHISKVIMTSHWDERGPFGLAWASIDPKRTPLSLEQVKVLFDTLSREATAKYHHMKFYLGSEFYYTQPGVAELKRGNIPTLAGTRYVLTEFHLSTDYDYLWEGMKTLQLEGFLPILAHTERYDCIIGREDRLRELVKMGVVIQVNSKTFLRNRTNTRTQWAFRMLDQGWIHVLGTDTHNLYHRPPVMKETVEKLDKYFSAYNNKKDMKMLEDILFNNPGKILDNQYL